MIVLQIATTTEEFVFILDSKDTFFGGVPCFEAKSSPDIGRLRRTVRTVHVIRILVGMSRCFDLGKLKQHHMMDFCQMFVLFQSFPSFNDARFDVLHDLW